MSSPGNASGQQNFPAPTQGIATAMMDILDAKGIVAVPSGTMFNITIPWLQFFLTLWNRSGGTGGGSVTPTGSVIEYAGGATPGGGPWLLCDGTAVSRTQYSALFAALGTIWGPGDGATTFNLPDRRGRFGRGTDGMHATGAYGGADSVTLDITHLPSHTHAINDPGHNHAISDPGHVHTVPSTGTGGGAGAGGTTGSANTGNSATNITVNSHVTGITAQNTGGGAAFSIEPPFATFTYWIKT